MGIKFNPLGIGFSSTASSGGGGTVTSVNGDAGPAVSLSATDIPSTPAGNLSATDLQSAVDELQSDIDTRANQTLSNLISSTAINQDLIMNKANPFFRGGDNFAGNSEAVGFRSGTASGNSGDVTLYSGAGAGSGAVTVRSSDSPGTGSVTIRSGNASGGNSGAVTLQTGTATGTRGKILIKDGSEGTAGHVLTSLDTVGTVGWAAPSSGASGVSGAIQFSNGSVLASDATNLFWDDANNRLGIGTNAPSLALAVTPATNGTCAKVGNGTYISSFNGDGFFSAGATVSSGGVWTATETAASSAYFTKTGVFQIFANSPLTIGVPFSPTARFSVTPTNTNILTGALTVPKTITTVGVTGNQTINNISGTVNFAAAATSLTVTCNNCFPTSIVLCTIRTNDSTMKSVQAVPASGSFTLYANAAPTAETSVGFLVMN